MSDDGSKERAFRWFLAGFRQSRKGYNAEYTASHLQPGVVPQRQTDDALSENTIPELRELFENELRQTKDGLVKAREALSSDDN